MKPYEDRRFEFVRRLGAGGTAEVALISIAASGRLAALKYPLTDDSEARAQFHLLAEREHRLIGARRHPGLVRILETSPQEPPWLLLEYCPGPTLDSVGRLANPAEGLTLLATMAAQLEALRFWGLVHGDLKPHNLFLPSVWQDLLDKNQFVISKLSDFSLGYGAGEPVSARLGMGTVGYMAPETIATGACTHRSDLFALGVIAYQMLTGTHPFILGETDPVRINAQVREDEPRPLAEFVPEIGDDVQAIISRLLAKNPDERYDSAYELCQAFESLGVSGAFRRLWRPGWLLSRAHTVEEILHVMSPRATADADFIRDRAANQADLAIALLDHNYRLGNIRYDNGIFAVTGDLVWPSRMRRVALKAFGRLNWSDRHRLLTRAVVDTATVTAAGSEINDTLPPQIPRAALPALVSLLRPATVRQLSKRAAVVSDLSPAVTLGLWLQSGDLNSALGLLPQAVDQLKVQNRAPDAVRVIDRLLDLAEVSGRTAITLDAQMLRADLLKSLGSVPEAEQAYRRIIEQYAQRPVDALLAETWKDLGDLYKMKRDYQAGIAALHNARDIYQSLGDELELSHTYNNLGNIYWVKSDLSSASREYRRALRIQRRLKAIEDVASTLSNLGGLECNRGRISRSVALLELSLKLKSALSVPGETARTLNNLGYAYYLSRRESQAIDVLARALEINRQIGNRKEVLQNMENLAAVMLSAARLGEAEQLLREALALAEELGDTAHCASLRLYAGTLFSRVGRFRDAATLLTDARQLLTKVNDPNTAVHIDAEAARLRWLAGDGVAAIELSTKVRQFAESVPDGAGILKALTLKLQIDFDEQTYQTARLVCHDLRAEREARLIDALFLRHRGRSGQPGLFESVRSAVMDSLSNAQVDIDLPLRALIFLDTTQRHEEVVAALNRGLSVAEQAGLLPELGGLLAWRARQRHAAGEFEQAFADYRRALETYREMLEQLDEPADQDRFMAQPHVVALQEGITCLARRLVRKDKAGTSPAFMQS